MIRTQVYLPKDLYEDVKLRARQADKSAAEVIRELISGGIAAKYRQHATKSGGVRALANLHITGGPADLSSKLDEYLYGRRR